MIKFPSIEQFNNIVRAIQQKTQFVEKLEDGTVIVDRLAKMPVIEFNGYVKLHGTNAGICYNKQDGIWYQSRENIISLQYDNAGFASFCLSKNDTFQKIFNSIGNNLNINENETICLFGEWAGKGIQKGVGINEINKSFFIFGVYVKNECENKGRWIGYEKFDDITDNILNNNDNIYHIKNYQNYKITIDFNKHLYYQSLLHDLTMEVESECPVAKAFGFYNKIGEGIVWSYLNDGELMLFKTKGDKHANGSKVTVVKNQDNERLQLIYDIAQKVTPVWRLEQMLNLACDTLNGGIVEPKKIGEYLKMLNTDICKEDFLIISDSGLTFKDIVSTVSRIAKDYFISNM